MSRHVLFVLDVSFVKYSENEKKILTLERSILNLQSKYLEKMFKGGSSHKN